MMYQCMTGSNLCNINKKVTSAACPNGLTQETNGGNGIWSREGVPSRNPNPFLIFQGNFALTKGKQGLKWLTGA